MIKFKRNKFVFMFLLTASILLAYNVYAENNNPDYSTKESKYKKHKHVKKRVKEIERSGENSVPSLIRLLNDDDPDTRISAMSSLGRIGSKKAIAPIIKLMENDKDDNIRISAATVLGYLSGTEAIPALKKALSDSNKMIQIRAAGSLGMLNDGSGYAIIFGYSEDADINVKANALQAFGLIADERAISILGKYKDDNNYRLRKAALISIRQIGIAREYRIALQKYGKKVADYKKLSLLEYSLSDTNPIIRKWALRILILRIDEKEVVELLVRIANNDKNPSQDNVMEVLKNYNIAFDKRKKK